MDLEAMLRVLPRTCPLRLRRHTAIVDGLLLLFGYNIVDGLLSPSWTKPFSTVVLVMALPFAYVLVFEGILGTTPARWFRNLWLADAAGGRPAVWKRVARATLKLAIFFSPTMILSAVLFIVSSAARSLEAMDAGWLLSLIALVVGPLLGYGAVYLRLSGMAQGWTVHDLLTGVQLVERRKTEASPQAVPLERADVAIPPRAGESRTDTVDQYDMVALLGSGGMGAVYHARDRTLHRDVAIKTLAGHLLSDDVQIGRFRREARLAAQIDHPHVARVYGAGRWGESPYIAMEFIDGENLQKIVDQRGPLKIESAWRYCIEAAEALCEADRHQIVHRDIKPSNLMVTRQGTLKVTDFGISRTVEGDMSVTKTGTILGTPWYMSPEQAMGKEVDRRSDIYSLGMTLYFLVSGRPAFQGSNPMEVLAQQVADEPPSLEGRLLGMTPERWAILRRMIAKDKADRHADYAKLLSDLRREQPGAAKFAPLTARLGAEIANLAPWLFFVVLGLLAVTLFTGLRTTPPSTLDNLDILLWVWLAACGLVFVFMYIWGVGRYGKTLGKHALKLRVTKTDGQRVGYMRATLRFIIAYPIMLIYAPAVSHLVPDRIESLCFWCNVGLLLLSAVLARFHPQRRMLHDLAAGTIVVRLPEDTT